MEKIISLTLLAGLCFISLSASQYQFVLVPTPKTWYDAQKSCRMNCLDLATIHDMEEMNKVLQLIEAENEETVWFGLQGAELGSWHWSLTGKDFYKKGEEEYLSWGSDELMYNCGSYWESRWYSLPCNERLPFICFNATNVGKDQYVLIMDTKNWTDAQNYCRTHHTDLTSVRNYDERDIIRNLLEKDSVWVGRFMDSWAWSDKNDSSFRNWASDVSMSGDSKGCVATLKKESGRWRKVECEETHPFLCSCLQEPKHFTVKISLQNPALDFNDPAVQDSILEQMKLRVRETTGAEGVQLRWKKQSNGTVFEKETP